MSGSEGSRPCPECGSEMDTYYDTKPHEFVHAECLECGFYYTTIDGWLSLRRVNEFRKEMDLKPLKRLKE